MSEASGHRGLWTEPKHPGDVVRNLMLYRGGHGRPVELGEICIQQYGKLVRVASFLPGFPGDTPKTGEKEQCFRADNRTDLADAEFDKFVQEAYAGGWQNYYPEQHGALR